MHALNSLLLLRLILLFLIAAISQCQTPTASATSISSITSTSSSSATSLSSSQSSSSSSSSSSSTSSSKPITLTSNVNNTISSATTAAAASRNNGTSNSSAAVNFNETAADNGTALLNVSSTTPSTIALLRMLGYERLNGNCKGAAMGRQMDVPLEMCAQLCNENKFCAGFSYSDDSQTCYLKEKQCTDPDSRHPFRFFKRLNFTENRGIPLGYEELEGNCRGHTLSPGFSLTIDKCAQQCNETFNCAGFSYSVQNELCYLKGAWCDSPKADSTYKFYKKEISDERFEVPGYLKLVGNCKGNILGTRIFGEIGDCASRCADNTMCVGFSYSREEHTCFLKAAHCRFPSRDGNYNFYEKLQPNKTNKLLMMQTGNNQRFSHTGSQGHESPESQLNLYTVDVTRPPDNGQEPMPRTEPPVPLIVDRIMDVPKKGLDYRFGHSEKVASLNQQSRYALKRPPETSYPSPFIASNAFSAMSFSGSSNFAELQQLQALQQSLPTVAPPPPPPSPPVSLNWRFPKDPRLNSPAEGDYERMASVVTKRLGDPTYQGHGGKRPSKLGENDWGEYDKKLHSPYENIHRRTLIGPKKYKKKVKSAPGPELLVDVYGYFRFAGNCPGHYLAGSPDATSLQDCANLCSRREDCAGFSFDPIDLMCVLKSADCWPPQSGSRQIFYHKDMKWQGQGPEPTEVPKLINAGHGGGQGGGKPSEYTGGGIPDPHEGSDEDDGDSYQHRFPEVPGYLRLNGNCHTEILGIEEIPNAKACGAHCSLYAECAGFSFNFYHYKCILRAESCMNARESQHSNFYEKVIPPVTILDEPSNCTRGELYSRDFVIAFSVSEESANMQPFIEITGHRAFLGEVWVNITNEVEGYDNYVKIGYEETIVVDLPLIVNLSEPAVAGKTYTGRKFKLQSSGGDVVVKKGYYITATMARRGGQQTRPSSQGKAAQLGYTYIIICQLESKYCTASMTTLFNATQVVIAGAPWLSGSLISDPANNAQVQVTTYEGKRKSFTKPLSTSDLGFSLNEGDQIDVKPGKSGILTGTSVSASHPIAIVVFGGSVARPMSDPPGTSVFGKIKAQVLPTNVLSHEYMIVCHPRAIACTITICHASPGQAVVVTLKHDSIIGDKRAKVFVNDAEQRLTGPSVTLTLFNEYDTIQITSKLMDLTGLRVFSTPNNTKIAVFIDLEIDSHFGTVQLPPLDHFAGRYLVQQADFRSTRVEEAVVVAVEPQTQVQILSTKLRIALEKSGDTYVTPLVSGLVTSIFATTPLIVLHTIIPDTTVRAISLQFVPTPPAWMRKVVIGRPSNVTFNATQLASIVIQANQIDMLEWNGEPLTGLKVEPIMGTGEVIGRFAIVRPEQLGTLQHITQLVPFQVAVTDWGARSFEYIGYKIRGHCSGCLPQTDGRLVPVFRDLDSICEAATGVEVCGDFVDNDLDGKVDEDCPPPTGYCRTVSNEGVDDFPFMYLLNQPWISRNFLPEVYAITREQNGQIFIESTSPAASKTYLGETILMNALQTTFFNLPNYFLPEGNEQSTRGIRVRPIRPMVPISVFVVNRENGSVGATLVLPKSLLGKRYFAVMWSPTIGGGEIGVLAVEDFTKVTISFSNPLVPIVVNFRNKIYTNKDTLTLILPKYNAIHIVSEKATSDLSGTEVLANSSVAVFSGNMASIIPMDYVGPMNDHTFEQLLPVEYWGQVFILPIGPDPTADDYFKITAAYSSTVVTVYGLEEGGNISLPYTGSTTMIKVSYLKRACLDVVASKPIQIAMFLSLTVGRDPSMVMVPPMRQWRNNYVFTTADLTKSSADPNDFTNYVLLAYRQTDHNKLVLNTKYFPMRNRVITSTSPISPSYYCTYLKLPTPGFQQLLNDAGNKFLALVFGRRQHETYAFSAGLAFDQYFPCQPCQAYYPCDNIDNDCDGSTDEEICDGTDNDRDGLIDEDCCGGLGTLDVPPSGCYDVKNEEFCYGTNSSISCPETEDIENRKTLKILSAHFGRSGRVGESSCSNIHIPPMSSCPFINVYNQTRLRCEGRYSCTFNVSMVPLAPLPSNLDLETCPLCVQYLRLSYVCLSKAQRNCSDLATRQFVQPYIHYSASSYAQPMLTTLNSTSVCRKSEDSSMAAERNKYFPPPEPNCPFCDLGQAKDVSMRTPSHPMFAFFDTDGSRAWCAAPCDLDHPYLQLDLGMVYPLTGFVIQGRRTHNHFISQFMLSFSNNGREWEKIMENGFAKQFDGNVNGWDVVFCDLRRFQVSARYVRMDVIAYSGHPCAHFEIFRCENGTGCTPLTIPHSTMMEYGSAAETMYDFKCLPGWYNGRNNSLAPLESVFAMNCTTEGVWQYVVSDFPCTDFRGCGPIPEMPMSLHTASSYNFGSEVIYSCLDGQRITGNISIVCQEDGTWSQAAAECDTFEDITDP